jgi:hypothetical protein
MINLKIEHARTILHLLIVSYKFSESVVVLNMARILKEKLKEAGVTLTQVEQDI